MARAPRHEVETEEQPEQLVHGVISITAASVGTAIDTGPAMLLRFFLLLLQHLMKYRSLILVQDFQQKDILL